MSRDARTTERRAQILDVAFELLGTEGMAGTTVRRVCEATKLNPRYFYESFPDLDALLVAVFDKVINDAVAATVVAVAAVVPAEDEVLVRTTIAAFARHVSEDPRRARILFMEGLNNEALGQRRFDMLHDMANTMVRDAMGITDPGQTIDDVPPLIVITSNLFIGGMAELVMSWVTGRLDVTLDELVDDTTALFMVLAEGMVQLAAKRGIKLPEGPAPQPG
jgi:AcrR family transcriptional regulator